MKYMVCEEARKSHISFTCEALYHTPKPPHHMYRATCFPRICDSLERTIMKWHDIRTFMEDLGSLKSTL